MTHPALQPFVVKSFADVFREKLAPHPTGRALAIRLNQVRP